MASAAYTASGLHVAANTGNTGIDPNTGVMSRVMTVNTAVAVSQTDSVLVAAVSGKKIRVIGFSIGAAGTATTWTLGSKGSGATTALCGPFNCVANGAISMYGDYGLFDCVESEGLVVTTGAGATTTFFINYVLI